MDRLSSQLVLCDATPKPCKGAAEELIKDLCKNDPSLRIAMRKGEATNIKTHSWYKGFDWDAMMERTMVPPFKPTVKNAKDIKNFNAKDEDRPPQIHYKADKSAWDKDFATST